MEIIFETSGQESENLSLLEKYGFCNIQITNKQKGNNLQIYRELKNKYPKLSYNLTYSVLNNYGKTKLEVLQNFTSFASNLTLPLLVSGSNPNKTTSLEILQNINFGVAVAFNPFVKQDYQRLIQKIQTGNVGEIYFQIGFDELVIGKYAKLIQREFPKIKIVISVLFASSKLLSNWSFRPWKGVFLGQEFLKSLSNADIQSYKLLSFCKQNNLSVLCTIFGDWEERLIKIREICQS